MATDHVPPVILRTVTLRRGDSSWSTDPIQPHRKSVSGALWPRVWDVPSVDRVLRLTSHRIAVAGSFILHSRRLSVEGPPSRNFHQSRTAPPRRPQ